MNIKEKDDKFTAAWMDRCHKLELELIEVKNKLGAKPKVTRAFVEKWAKGCEQLYINCDLLSRFFLNLPCQLEKMLKEAGMEVEEK